MKKKIYYLLISVAILFFLSCTNKKSDGVPKPGNASGADLRTGTLSDSVCGNYCNPNNPTPNDKNAFCIRYFDKIKNPTDPPRPLIITFHGGGYTGGDKKTFKLPLTIGNSFPILLTTQDLDNNKFAYASANYRILNFSLPRQNLYDSITIKSCFNDCKAFVEYMRLHAADYNIDPNKIILMGHSGGAGAALWIGLQNNLIAGVTIKGIVTLDAQATMNILEWKDKVFVPADRLNDYNQAVDLSYPKILDFVATAQLFYKTAVPDSVTKYCKTNKLSFLSLFDQNDPELYMGCQAVDTKYDIIHHPAHDWALNTYSKAAGHKSRIQFTLHPYFYNANYETLTEFFVRKFQ